LEFKLQLQGLNFTPEERDVYSWKRITKKKIAPLGAKLAPIRLRCKETHYALSEL